MSVAMRINNGLHHAVSMGTIDTAVSSTKPMYTAHTDRNYDSEDENTHRRRLRHTSSTELYPRPSQYSKGDIREQYCLTDRQVNTIDRSRRDRFFGCLSRKSTPQSLLGGCVGRRIPSDENLAPYAPFYKHPRYQHQQPQLSQKHIQQQQQQQHQENEVDNMDSDSSYFRRQPASILSTSKMVDASTDNPKHSQWLNQHQHQQQHQSSYANYDSISYMNDKSSYHCPSHMGGINADSVQYQMAGAPATPRTKHVSFARSHTLTSFDDFNVGFRSLGRMKSAQSQERLIGGKKPLAATATYYDTMPLCRAQIPAIMGSTSTIHMIAPAAVPLHPRSFPHMQHHMGHIQGAFAMPGYVTEQHVQTQQPTTLLATGRPILEDMGRINITSVIPCQLQTLPPPSPEVVVIEKKFRNAMKTQATQTDTQKNEFEQQLALSPRTIHRVRVVSQGAQTNGLQNGKPLAKSLSQIPAELLLKDPEAIKQLEHETLHRAQSEEPPNSPLEINFAYYQPPPPLEYDTNHEKYYRPRGDKSPPPLAKGDSFSYESNSLPRRTCGYRLDTDFHSLPRRDMINVQDVCKHITECSELIADDSSDFTADLLPPPQEYCHNDDDDSLEVTQSYPKDVKQRYPKEYSEVHRRKSMVVAMDDNVDSPFRRDDIRRQSMPVYVKQEKLLDVDYAAKSKRFSRKLFRDDMSDEKEIIIDFKPYITPEITPFRKGRFPPKKLEVEEIIAHQENEHAKVERIPRESVSIESDQSEDRHNDPVYENIHTCSCNFSYVQEAECSEQEDKEEKGSGISAPNSPLREGPIGHASTYPSSDSLANDNTRDHSDGHWNESEVTVLTAEQRSEASYNSNLLLTPSTKRKHLLLQHQQRSSIDTDALEMEEQFTDQSPTFSQASMKSPRSPIQPHHERDLKIFNGKQIKLISPSIEITPSSMGKVCAMQRSSMKNLQVSPKRCLTSSPLKEQRRASDISLGLSSICDIFPKTTAGNADNSECSTTNTNTEEYGTCTDTSRRTAGMRTTLNTTTTTTSSSSTTQVPVSTQSSQMDKTHGESSFESASSLYSSKGEILLEDLDQPSESRRESKTKMELNLPLPHVQLEISKKSPTHSISSTSSGSYNVEKKDEETPEKLEPAENNTIGIHSPAAQQKEHVRIKMESISDDDEKSEMRYSSSGYYESPHNDEYHKQKSRRYRQEEERKRRKTSMKIDIEKENMRALTSPVKRDLIKRSPERQRASNFLETATSPIKIKRFRPKIRRQLRRSSRDESIPRQLQTQQQRKTNQSISPSSLKPQQQQQQGNTEKLLDAVIMSPKSLGAAETTTTIDQDKLSPRDIPTKVNSSLSPVYTKSTSDICQLKAKSIESLNRSVSPGSDSVFYSEADGNNADGHSAGQCSHCGKMEGEDEPSVVCGDSVESLPFIDNEPDIVKPPSDFADSPVATKTQQRLYKKMDKRFRSEERYHTERGRHYKSRKDNIRAKSEERNQECANKSSPNLRSTGSSPCILPENLSDNRQQTIYIGHYDCSRYARLTDSDIWAQLNHQSLDRNRGRRNSTDSEKSFFSKYQVILHRLVQRRCTLEMYHRQKNDKFQLITSNSAQDSLRRRLEDVLKLMLLVWAREGHVLSKLTHGEYGVDKTVVVKSDSGEFGFRIHGSKPVVVAAIEPETPAESSGLEVGDIIISVNGVQVLDKHHTEVVKIAHDGCEKLELEVARTLGVLMNEQQEPPVQIIYSGYLWRQSGQAKGSPNTKKWVQRWFVLRSDNCLYYYKTEEDTQPVGAMIMAKHIVESCPSKIGKPHAFKVDSGEGIPMYVAADNEEMSNRWINILKKSAAQENSWLDKSARNLYKQPSSITRPDCFGYLMKLGSKWCGWSKRYCVLKDACLYFFQDANSKSALGMVCLHGYKVSSMTAAASGKKNSFEIVPPEAKLRHYYFYTESEMEKKRWISALEYSIDRWIKSG